MNTSYPNLSRCWKIFPEVAFARWLKAVIFGFVLLFTWEDTFILQADEYVDVMVESLDGSGSVTIADEATAGQSTHYVLWTLAVLSTCTLVGTLFYFLYRPNIIQVTAAGGAYAEDYLGGLFRHPNKSRQQHGPANEASAEAPESDPFVDA